MHTTRFASVAAAALVLLFSSLSTFAHGPDAHPQGARVVEALEHTPAAPAPGATIERLTGEMRHVTIADRVTGITVEHYALKLDDGTAVALKNVQRTDLVNGDRVEATGRRNGQLLFSSGIRTLRNAIDATNQKAKTVSINGTLALLHVDDFDSGRSDFVFELQDESGTKRHLDFGVPPEALQAGMAVHVSGVTSTDGATIVPAAVVIDALPIQEVDKDFAKAVRTNNVLVILMTFTDSGGQPFTQAQVQSTVGGGPGSGSVAEYFKEASFGQQLMNVTVTPWLATGAATPANCDWQTMGTLGRNAATAAGYTVGNYQNVVYVFPAVAACGWTGLGYIGASGVWINGRNLTSVYGHELGHNFGLLHAGSLRCTGAVIGGSCSVSEYGDPFDTMGNQSAMHYNAMQKVALGWIAAGTVQTHTTGTRTYVLSPIETGGASSYAVKIAAASNRTYWLEYRQPIGFDAGLASYPNNGAQVRVASPFETLCSGCNSWSNDTQLLDMTPATGTFTDAALTVGNSFTDSTYNVTISVVSASSTSLTLTVTTPGTVTATSTSLSSSSNPANSGTSVTFTATVTGTSPTGLVSFTADGAALCNAVTLSGSGNTKTAACNTTTLAAGSHSIVASYTGDAGNGGSTSGALSEVVNATANAGWADDGLPVGVTVGGDNEGWNWVSSNPAPFSGGLAHQSAIFAGAHQHYFWNASAVMSVLTGDTLYAYVYLDPANPPAEVMLQWNDGSWEHRAYWGANSIPWGTDGSVSRRYMGPLPAMGQWVRLSVPAFQVGLEGRPVNGMAFTLYGGRATWDVAGRVGASPGAAWVDDSTPAGAALYGDADSWNWVSNNPSPLSGSLAHQSSLVAGVHQHYFMGAAAALNVQVGDTLYTYVYLDPANPPTEVMLQWLDGSWEHRAYWGANQIPWGTDATNSRRWMGPLPPAGQWVRLSVPASQVGLEGRAINGMAFTLYGGRATWDKADRAPASGAWVDDGTPAGATLMGDNEPWNWVSSPPPTSGSLAHQSALVTGMHQHYFLGATATLTVNTGDTLYAYVYLDSANPPTEVMLQWLDGSWEHRAYWGANQIPWGADGTSARRYMGALPGAGQWVRLAVPASQVGLEGRTLSGMAFTLFGGRATWDVAGK